MAVNHNLTRTAEGYNTIEFGGVNLGAMGSLPSYPPSALKCITISPCCMTM